MTRVVELRLNLAIFLIALCTSASDGQTRRAYPVPPEPAVRESSETTIGTNHRVHLDRVAIEREAKEMAALAATIPGDVEQMKKGLLPSDSSGKLKRIEKLSRLLQSQMRP